MKKGPKRDAAVRQFVKLAEGRVRNPQQVTKLVDAIIDAVVERITEKEIEENEAEAEFLNSLDDYLDPNQ